MHFADKDLSISSQNGKVGNNACMNSRKATPLQCRDTCLALSFLLLLIWFFTKNAHMVYAAMALLLLGMVFPRAMQAPARAWFGLSHLLGQVTSRLLFGIIWLLLVLPVGLIRRMLGKDALRLTLWKQGDASCFVTRAHVFRAEDLKNPY